MKARRLSRREESALHQEILIVLNDQREKRKPITKGNHPYGLMNDNGIWYKIDNKTGNKTLYFKELVELCSEWGRVQ